MPFKSEKQRRFLWMHHPEVARAWAHSESSVTGKKEGHGTAALHRRRQRRKKL